MVDCTAMAFCYFETLSRTADKEKFTVEEVRLKSMQNLLRDIGLQEHLYEDFVEETLDMLRETANATDNGAGLLEAFNDFSRSQSIITYLKACHFPF
jgi:ubiquitin thioesterase protein OTUB1